VTAAVFLDRDGVLTRLVPDPNSGQNESPLTIDQVTLLPGAASAVRRLRDTGYVVVGISNQPAAAKGVVQIGQLGKVQARVLELLAREGAAPDAFRICFHHPEGTIPGLTLQCDCRKPAPGMLLEAAEELELDLGASWMVGDTDSDVLAGEAAGCRTVLIDNPGSAHKRAGVARADASARDLATAVEIIVDMDKR
jgi:D-glycero-D-manno-heptose 1,7-bisphosphate phosphatase